MTNESISGFLTSIAEAKRAFDAEPGYQQQIARLEAEQRRLRDTIAQRELRIHELKQNEETLTQTLRSVEAERDNAGFRALEEADKVSALLTLVRQHVGDCLKTIAAVEGSGALVVIPQGDKQELIELRVAKLNWEDESEKLTTRLINYDNEVERLNDDLRLAQSQLVRPTPPASDASSLRSEGTGSTTGETSSSTERSTSDLYSGYSITDKDVAKPEGQSHSDVGQREPDPTLAVDHSSIGSTATDPAVKEDAVRSDGPFASTETTQSAPATSTSVDATADAASRASPPERNRDESTRFLNRKYYDVTYFVPFHEWIAKGGTEADYHWRPAEGVSRASHQS